jgi:prevent-host-death family protein
MNVFTMHEAKTNLSKLIKLVEAGEEVVIARGNSPVVRLLPIVERGPKLGQGSFADLRGAISNKAFFDPLPEVEQKLWEGGQ